MTDNLTLHRKGHDAFSRGDMDFLAELFADDVLWHVAGRSPLAGDYRGRDAVFGFFERIADLTGGNFELEDQFFLDSGDRTVALFKLKGRRGDKVLDHDFCEVVRWENGQVAEDWGFAFDQYSYDEFWA